MNPDITILKIFCDVDYCDTYIIISPNPNKLMLLSLLTVEYTRVQLHLIEGIEHSDYINANYINVSDLVHSLQWCHGDNMQGPSDEVEYIAAQGPLPHTVGDFWRMLWYHNIEVSTLSLLLLSVSHTHFFLQIVIMACREVEMGKV